MVLDGGRQVVMVNSCFEDLEGRMGLKRVLGVYCKGRKKEELKSEGEQ